jgi:uncharacterized protein YjbI with pentapeptide repeats
MARANLDGVVMMDANLTGAHFHGTDLRGVFMVGSRFLDARLEGAKVATTVLNRDALSKRQLAQVVGAEEIIWR